ncbi:MAG: hypothetical protein MUF54_03535 [Polyangiaceae bacterium]|jgi:hypothetical protein|nr:hypothetical protein [Polyangiaceae bacterium]
MPASQLVPGVAVGALWSRRPNVDVGAWFNWTESIRAKGAITVEGPICGGGGLPTQQAPRSSTSTTGDGVETVAPRSMQVRLGVCFHQADAQQALGRGRLVRDAWDLEIMRTCAYNSMFDDLTATLSSGVVLNVVDPQDSHSQGSFTMPTSASISHRWEDAFGVRVRVEWVIVPEQLAVRAGAFFETEAQDSNCLHAECVPSKRLRVTFGGTACSGDLDVMEANERMFYDGLDDKWRRCHTGGCRKRAVPHDPRRQQRPQLLFDQRRVDVCSLLVLTRFSRFQI